MGQALCAFKHFLGAFAKTRTRLDQNFIARNTMLN